MAATVTTKPEKKRLTFKIPEGLDLEGKEDGEMLEVVAELKLEDGKLCLKKVNGIELGEYDEEKKSKPSFTEAVSGDEEGDY